MLKILGVRRKQVQNSLGDKKHVRLKSRRYAFTDYGTWKEVKQFTDMNKSGSKKLFPSLNLRKFKTLQNIKLPKYIT
jgi:hypothetical protein